MNLKTDPVDTPRRDQSFTFTNKFLLQICLLTLIALLALFSVERFAIDGTRSYSSYRYRAIDSPLVFPWMSAANAFYWLDQHAWLSLSNRLVLLSGILIVLIICPTVVLFGWRSRRLERAAPGSPAVHPPNISSIAYLFCGIVMLFVGIPLVPMAVIQQVRYVSSCENDAARVLRYNVQHDINVVTADAFQYRILPKTAGGGEGSYLGYSIPERLASTDNAEFTATVQADSVMLTAESAFCATDRITLSMNSNGQTGLWRYVGNWGTG